MGRIQQKLAAVVATFVEFLNEKNGVGGERGKGNYLGLLPGEGPWPPRQILIE